MQPHQADIFLVVLEEEGGEADGIPEHDQEHTGNLRVKGPGVTDLAAKHPADPCSYLVT